MICILRRSGRSSRVRERDDVAAVVDDAAERRLDRGAGCRRPSVLLPQPLSPTSPTRLAAADAERHAVDGAEELRWSREEAALDREVLRRACRSRRACARRAPAARRRRRGSDVRSSGVDSFGVTAIRPRRRGCSARGDPVARRSTSSGSASRHASITIGQRSAKRQPGGRSRRSGTMPFDRRQARRACRSPPRARANAECCRGGRACTDGAGARRCSATGALSTTRPAYMTTTSLAYLGDDAEIVRDEERRSSPAALAASRGARGSAPGSSRRARSSARRR